MAKQESSVKERQRTDMDEPRQFKVIFHNDDFTTFEFVVKVLMTVFFKSKAEAERLTIEVDRKKLATVGVYSRDVAVTKMEKATKMARAEGFPLRITCEPLD
ncbi:MAG: ATP-dependent Clp protease adaptor ClpS [Paludibacteraceae bacterium]|nr:ATP-dependent Clp protease adaptor ClpS [Paludibacteraceae bacterium]MBR4815041.1 ATP-dependent Clp protease adaptor ClpS [Paludibacteraceae bacterium]MCR5497205.1 ATP-dependent Clp protease adaptor ClpS [Paludibacteraceae bacterium]